MKHIVAIVGGATAGSEAALHLAQRGVEVVVFEMNRRPYGKIEDGLPRWHTKQRVREYENIDERLDQRGIHVVPLTKLGRDLDFVDLATRWGFSAVLLANGAWRDRDLPIAGAEDYVGRGIVYQNALVHWFNHYPEPDYDGPRYEVPDGALVVGGGLASFDVVKICMIETTRRALERRGIEVDLLSLEHGGLSRALNKLELRFEDLGVEPCTLAYRRRARDMPVVASPEDLDEAALAKVEGQREKILESFASKFCCKFRPLLAPTKLIIEDGRCAGLEFNTTEVRGGRVITLDAPRVTIRAPMVISSIGSLPAPIDGVEMDGDYYRFRDEKTGEYTPLPGVFGMGNVITGKGNIQVSLKHGHHIAERVGARLENETPPSAEVFESVMNRVRARQAEVGYSDYGSWMAEFAPVDV